MSGVLFDIQGVQSRAHGERGIARYLLGLALELERRHPQLVASFLLNPDLPVPTAVEPLAAVGRLDYAESVLQEAGSAFHVGSPIELDIHLDRLWPRQARSLPLVVTLYDLIPEIFADFYLGGPAVRRRYRTRLQLLRRADRVLAISRATARDAVERLGLAPDRVVSVGTGVAEHFRPPPRPEDAVDALAARLPEVRAGFVLYTGGIDYRKNIDPLLVAYASLARRLRDEHQLVIVCRITPADKLALAARLAELGVSEHVVLPGFVSEPDLVLLYQAAELFVFPSLYEGFGLPVAEAMACGTPVIAARTSSLVELVDDDDALFDPTTPHAIAAALRNALRNADFRERLRSRGLDARWRWPAVADKTAEVYSHVTALPRRRPRLRPRIAFVSPLPPHMSGVADYSYRLLGEIAQLVDVDAFADASYGPADAPAGVSVHSLRSLESVELARAGYDGLVACLGNSDHHAETLALLRRRPATVLAHDVRLTGLYAWTSRARPELESRTFHEVLHDLYPTGLPPEVGKHGWLDVDEYDRYGILMAREAIGRSVRFLVHSTYAAQLARLDGRSEDLAKIGVVPFGFPDPADFGTRKPDAATVGTFGVVAPVKQTERIIEAFALVAARRQDAHLAIVGPASAEERSRLGVVAARLGVAERIELTGELPREEFAGWLARATVAVQLRAASNGEASATVAECLAAGIPTIATALGSTRELPEASFVGVDREVSAPDLAATIEAVLSDRSRQRALSDEGRRHARANSFAHAANALVDELLGAARQRAA